MTDKNISCSNKKSRLAGITLLYFVGVLSGVILYSFPPIGYSGKFEASAENFISARLNKEFAEILVNSFCEPFIMLLICFMLGLSAIAHPAEYLVPVFHGFGTGITISGFYAEYAFQGIGMSAVMIIPGAVISAFAIIIAVREALNMSSEICSAAFGRNSTAAQIDFRLYFTKYVILCAMIVAGAFAESMLTFFFADLWQV